MIKKGLIVALLAVGLSATAVSASEPVKQGSTATAQSTPQMAFEKTTHDFGTIAEELGTVSYEFVFKNTGKTPLVINRVVASCGCTTPEWPKEPVAPGKSAKVKATYSAKNRPGAFNKTISIYTNTQEGAIPITIKGVVTPKKK